VLCAVSLPLPLPLSLLVPLLPLLMRALSPPLPSSTPEVVLEHSELLSSCCVAAPAEYKKCKHRSKMMND
jgi:hypothetical protein